MAFNVRAYGLVPYYVEKNDVKILLCSSFDNKDKWGCLKGVKSRDETAYDCAKREFFEESSILVPNVLFEDYFEQLNLEKSIGVWLVNVKNIDNFDKYFKNDVLKANYSSFENSEVKFFSINKLPKIKSKQQGLIKNIKDFLQNKSLYR